MIISTRLDGGITSGGADGEAVQRPGPAVVDAKAKHVHRKVPNVGVNLLLRDPLRSQLNGLRPAAPVDVVIFGSATHSTARLNNADVRLRCVGRALADQPPCRAGTCEAGR